MENNITICLRIQAEAGLTEDQGHPNFFSDMVFWALMKAYNTGHEHGAEHARKIARAEEDTWDEDEAVIRYLMDR